MITYLSGVVLIFVISVFCAGYKNYSDYIVIGMWVSIFWPLVVTATVVFIPLFGVYKLGRVLSAR